MGVKFSRTSNQVKVTKHMSLPRLLMAGIPLSLAPGHLGGILGKHCMHLAVFCGRLLRSTPSILHVEARRENDRDSNWIREATQLWDSGILDQLWRAQVILTISLINHHHEKKISLDKVLN